MTVIAASLLASLIGVGIIAMSVRAFWAPHAAAGFGIPGTPTEDRTFQAWLRVKAVRDVVSGVFILVLLVAAPSHLLGWFVVAASAIPAGDAVIVLRSGGARATALGVHASTAAAMVIIGILLIAG